MYSVIVFLNEPITIAENIATYQHAQRILRAFWAAHEASTIDPMQRGEIVCSGLWSPHMRAAAKLFDAIEQTITDDVPVLRQAFNMFPANTLLVHVFEAIRPFIAPVERWEIYTTVVNPTILRIMRRKSSE